VFIQTVIEFLIIAFVIFMAVKGINKLKRQPAPAAPAAPPPPPREEVLLEEIRDLLKKRGLTAAPDLPAIAAKTIAGQVLATVRGHREIVLDANPPELPECVHARPIDARAARITFGRVQQLVVEYDPRLHRDHEAFLQDAREPQETDVPAGAVFRPLRGSAWNPPTSCT